MTYTLTLTDQQVSEIAAQAAGVQAGTIAPPAVYPREEIVDGTKVLLQAPINPAWLNSFYGRALHSATSPQAPAQPDPSNGNEATPAQPLRSAAGWPLQYGLDATGKVLGTPSVLYDGLAWNSDAEVDLYRAHAATAAANSRAGDDQGFGIRHTAAPMLADTTEEL